MQRKEEEKTWGFFRSLVNDALDMAVGLTGLDGTHMVGVGPFGDPNFSRASTAGARHRFFFKTLKDFFWKIVLLPTFSTLTVYVCPYFYKSLYILPLLLNSVSWKMKEGKKTILPLPHPKKMQRVVWLLATLYHALP